MRGLEHLPCPGERCPGAARTRHKRPRDPCGWHLRKSERHRTRGLAAGDQGDRRFTEASELTALVRRAYEPARIDRVYRTSKDVLDVEPEVFQI